MEIHPLEEILCRIPSSVKFFLLFPSCALRRRQRNKVPEKKKKKEERLSLSEPRKKKKVNSRSVRTCCSFTTSAKWIPYADKMDDSWWTKTFSIPRLFAMAQAFEKRGGEEGGVNFKTLLLNRWAKEVHHAENRPPRSKKEHGSWYRTLLLEWGFGSVDTLPRWLLWWIHMPPHLRLLRAVCCKMGGLLQDVHLGDSGEIYLAKRLRPDEKEILLVVSWRNWFLWLSPWKASMIGQDQGAHFRWGRRS